MIKTVNSKETPLGVKGRLQKEGEVPEGSQTEHYVQMFFT